ncbi:MAG TPA: GntR family transcriptional regulator [Corynebacterium variabile]|uniref:GntR family transcriptional regulator n=1 Tax=Corynebacterium variabile TaxID=1727 RepID=A0A3B9QUU7_9CORY|nr:GntR family transcriptional regulator [Corynebacterium variabile]HAF72703.1 GntR family transcriptional regulator [Corynebacterium variabile]
MDRGQQDPHRGRPRIQEQADAIVAGVLAGAGPRVGSREYSTRRISMMTGISQPLVSRAMRRIRGVGDGEDGPGVPTVSDPAGLSGRRTLRLSAFVVDFPRIRIDFTDGGEDVVGEVRAFERRATAVMAALRISGADTWPTTWRAPDAEELERAWDADHPTEQSTVDPDPELGPGSVRVYWEPGRQSWEVFLARVAGLFGACGRSVDAVPGALLTALSVRVGQGLHGVRWSRRGVVKGYGDVSPTVGNDPHSDSERSASPPYPTPVLGELSMAEQVAIALRKEITDAGYSAGDRVTSVVLASHMGLRQSAVLAAMRRLVDDGLLVSRNGVFSLPLVTGADIIDLYAARLQVGIVLLRACATRPRHRLLSPQTALRTLEAAVERGDAERVDQADLYFQQELAEASGLTQSARTFHSLTLRLQMFISVLQLNYGQAVPRILADDRRIMAALITGDAEVAVWTWRSKLDNAVRHMSAASQVGAGGGRSGSGGGSSRAGRTGMRFDVSLWERLTEG